MQAIRKIVYVQQSHYCAATSTLQMTRTIWHRKQILLTKNIFTHPKSFSTLSYSPVRRVILSESRSSWIGSSHRSPIRLWQNFHTSQTRKAVPLVALILKPITKFLAILTGRVFRQWWKGLPKDKQKYLLFTLKQNRNRILAAVGGSSCLVGIFYISHLETTPITNRKRVIFFTESQFSKIVQTEYEQQCKEYEQQFVDTSHNVYQVVERVALQLIKHNQHLPQIKNKNWIIHIVNDHKQKNAFVLPNGQIFVFTGLFHAVRNEEQLGIILAHEMAHVVLNHGAEQASFFEFFDWLMIIVLASLWAFLPNDGVALIATWFKNKVAELLIQMPYNRALEMEADEVGLQLAANSCFDVRESELFWETMAHTGRKHDEVQIEWLSTHPTHQNRAKYLGELIPNAIKMRELCNCPALPMEDPRMLLKSIQDEEKSNEPRTIHAPGIVINSTNL